MSVRASTRSSRPSACSGGRAQRLKMSDHPNKHIREAGDYATSRGWRLVKSGPRAHAGDAYTARRRHGEVVSLRFTAHHACRKTTPVTFGGASTPARTKAVMG